MTRDPLTSEPTPDRHDTRGRGWPMQAWVALLVIAATLPLAALLLWNARQEAQADEDAASRQVEQLARQMAAETDRFLEDTRLLLERTAQRPAIAAMDPARCDPLFADFRAQFPRYANLLLIDRDGGGVCASVPVVQGPNAYADFAYFKAVASGAPYHVDPPRIGRSSRRWIVAVAIPMRDDANAFRGALALAIDLERFPLSLLSAGALPPGAAIELVTRDGRYIAGGGSHGAIGTEAPEALRDALTGEARRVTLHGEDGGHLAALAPVTQAPWTAVARVPVQSFAGLTRERLHRNIGVAAATLLGVWLVAAIALRRTLGPLADIARAATAVAAGDPDARVRGGGPREVDAIAGSFNRMLDERARHETAMRISEARYRTLFETSSDAIVGIALDGRIAFANPAIEAVSGWPPAELVGRPFDTLCAPGQPSWSTLAVGGPGGVERRASKRRVETRCAHRDGHEVPVEMTFGRAEAGREAVVIAFLRDISERHTALADLRESEQRFRAMADSSPVLIWTADAIVQEFYFNATWLAFAGQTPEEARRAGWFGGVHPDDVVRVKTIIDAANRNYEGCTLEYRRRRHDGVYRWVIDTSAARFDESGRFLGYIGTAVDIHDRVVAEGRIRRLTRLYSALSQANEAIARSSDLTTLLQTVCDIVVQQTGIASAAVAMADESRTVLRSTAASGAFAAWFAQTHAPIFPAAGPGEFPGSVAFRTNRRVVSHDRETDAALPRIGDPAMRAALRSTAIFPLRRHGEPVGIIAVYAEQTGYFDDELTDLLELLATDLSYALDAFAARERRDQAEEALRRLNVTLEERVAERTRSLEAANRELEAFSYSVSHDLRAPLRGISGFSGLLQEGYMDRLDETGRNYLARVKAASTRMARLIDDLLNLSRISRQAIHRDDVDITALARDIVDELREADPARDVEVHVEAGLKAHADPGLARIALANLIDNAWKFTSQAPQARISVTRGTVEGRTGFTVRDNGAGFDLAYADKLFAPFQRLHGEREFAGTGIGLAIVQRIVHRHGGEVHVEAAPGEGAAFTFTLG